MSVKETCFPSENQMLFLGCSVMSFSVSAGLNEQQSELTVQLVEDDCPAEPGFPKKFRDCALREQDWTDPDPGFFGETCSIIGTPAYFRVANFEFSGIIQSWERLNDISNNPVYEVKLVDPRILLENIKIIMNDDTGVEPGILNNIYNALYWNEKERPGVGAVCNATQQFVADGVIAGSLAGYYGAANHNNNGITWDDIQWMIKSRVNSASLTDYVRFLSNGGSCGGVEGMGLLSQATGFGGYAIDLSELPTVPSYYRFDQTAASLMELISQVIQDSGYDYYVELIPQKFDGTPISCTGYAGTADPYDLVIKIRTIDRRTSVAASGSIKTFALATTNKDKVISYNEGRELRNDITQSMIMGGAKQSIWQADNGTTPGSVIPYFGLDPTTGDVIVPTLQGNGYWQVVMPTNDLSIQLSDARYSISIPATLLIKEQEMIIAQAGFDIWLSYASYFNTPLYAALSSTTRGVFDLTLINKIFADLQANPGQQARFADFFNLSSRGFKGHQDQELEILNIAYAWLNKIVSEYYGKMFQVLVPFTCTKISAEAMAFINTEKPTNSGWTEATPVIGITNPSSYMDFFRDESEKIQPFVAFNNTLGIELSSLSQDSYITDGTNAWIKANLAEQDYVYLDKSAQSGPRIVISLPQQIRQVDSLTSVPAPFNAIVQMAHDFASGLPIATAEAQFNSIAAKVGSSIAHEGVLNRALVPNAAAVAIESNLLRYGPWSAIGLGTVGGDTNIRVEEGLVPWEYAGYSLMNTAGNALVVEGITKQQIIDKGTVTIAGYPDLPLGAEILAIENGTLLGNGSGAHLFENRSANSRNTEPIRSDALNSVVAPTVVLDSGTRWEGTDGANITSITTRVSPEGIQTTYTMRVFTDKFGRFAKLNAKRLQTIGKWRLALTRYFRAFNRQRINLLNQQILNSTARPGMILNSKWGGGEKRASSEIIVGQLGVWNNDSFQRPIVAQMPVDEAGIEVGEEYSNKAFMSMDGLIRPISVTGGGGLPKFANPLGHCQITVSKGAQPPVDKTSEAGQLLQYNLDINIDYLNPFSNPSTSVPNRSDTPNHGHDIELIGRETGAPTGSLMMVPGGYLKNDDFSENDYSSDDDYRAFALRGPLLMQAWGYDLDGFPIPNKADNETDAKAGTFTNTSLQNKFLDNFLRKSNTWPVAPVDLRFDRERAVWTVPQYRDVFATLSEDISPEGSGTAIINSGPTLYDSGGNVISNPEIKVFDKINCNYSSGDKIIARFDPQVCQYYIIEACDSICVTSSDVCVTGNIGTVCEPVSSIEFGAGLHVNSTPGSNTAEIGAGMKLTNSNDCVTGTANLLYANDFNIAAGLRAFSGADECDATLGAGITFNNVGGCVTGNGESILFASTVQLGDGLKSNSGANDCVGKIGAGMDFAFQAGCVPGNKDITFANKIKIRDGLRASGDLNSCQVSIGAGIAFNNVGGCVIGNGENIPFANTIQLGDGLKSNIGVNDCIGKIGAGIASTNPNTLCIKDSTQNNGTFANKIRFQKGIWGSGNDDTCELHIGAGMDLYNSAGCITGSTDMLGVNHFDFVDGLRVGSGDAGVTGCVARIGAGFEFTNSTACVKVSEVKDIDFANKIVLGKGLIGSGDTGVCTISISAGLDVTNNSLCYSQNDNVSLANDILLGAGLGSSGDADNCRIGISAGMKFQGTADCVNALDTVNFANIIKYGRGLFASGDPDSCTVTLGAGFELQNSTECVEVGTAGFNVNKITFGKGINSKLSESSTCDAIVGAGFSFTNNETSPASGNVAFANEIYIGKGLAVASGANCSATIYATGAAGEVSGCSSNDCITVDHTACTGFSKITFAGGLRKQDFEDGHIKVGAGISGGNEAGCIQGSGNVDFFNKLVGKSGVKIYDAGDCTAHIGAGISIINGVTGCLSPSDSNFVNRITVGNGLRSKDLSLGGSPCAVAMEAGFSLTNNEESPSTGNVDFTNQIFIGKGLAVSSGADCVATIYATGISTISGCGSDDCITVNDVDCTGFNQITFAGGLRKQNFEDGHIKVGAGISGGNISGCIQGSGNIDFFNKLIGRDGIKIYSDTDCEAQIGAGIAINNGTTGCLSPSNSTFINNITLGSGLRSKDGGANCIAYMEAGISITGDSFCKPENPISVGGDSIPFTTNIHFGSGLKAGSGDNCISQLAAGFNFSNIQDCIQDPKYENITDIDFANTVKILGIDGGGLTGTTGENPCDLVIAGGFKASNTSLCVAPSERKWVRELKFGQGLSVGSGLGDQPCEATAHSYVEVGVTGAETSSEVQRINFGKCFDLSVSSWGDCQQVDVTYDCSGCTVPLTVVTDVYLTSGAIVVEKAIIRVCSYTGASGSEIPLIACDPTGYCP